MWEDLIAAKHNLIKIEIYLKNKDRKGTDDHFHYEHLTNLRK